MHVIFFIFGGFKIMGLVVLVIEESMLKISQKSRKKEKVRNWKIKILLRLWWGVFLNGVDVESRIMCVLKIFVS